MKIFIASDIHGSAFWCEKMLAAYKKENADKMLLLGDLLYHGPRNDLPTEYAPKKVIELLNARKNEILCVRGNCEAEVDQMVLKFPVLAEYALVALEKGAIFAAHGHNWNEENLPPLREGDILLNGHTHIPKLAVYENYVFMNPGSVSLPKENTPHSYIIYSEGKFLWKTLDGEIFEEYNYF